MRYLGSLAMQVLYNVMFPANPSIAPGITAAALLIAYIGSKVWSIMSVAGQL